MATTLERFDKNAHKLLHHVTVACRIEQLHIDCAGLIYYQARAHVAKLGEQNYIIRHISRV